MKTKMNPKIITRDESGEINGYIVPIYNVNETFHDFGKEPKQVYVTVVEKGKMKGPHLHHIRTGFFTCIKGNVKIVTKEDLKYMEYFSGEDYGYLSVIVNTGIPALIVNICDEDAIVLNMPNPAWTPEMNDEHTEDFSDYNFNE
jgi:dTDP-4-dehydrorhamnose 3,5-epimerase-like enzyme